MTFWLDAQFPADLAPWLCLTFGVEAWSVRELELRAAADETIYAAARQDAAVVILTKDADFADLFTRLGPPPRLVRVHCGNATRAEAKAYFERLFPVVLLALDAGSTMIDVQE